MDHDMVEMFRRKLDKLTVSDYYGLNSPGLTCYLNSALQVLFMTEDFPEAVKQCCRKKAATFDQHLSWLFDDLRKSEAKTHNIVKNLGITNVYVQRDAAEYFEKVLCLTSLGAAKMFRGELRYETTCVSCTDKMDSRGFFWSLPLAVEDSHGHTYSVEKGLNAFFKRRKVCGDNQIYCSHCTKKQDAVFKCEVTQKPKILTLLLKRFTFDHWCRSYVKLHSRVDVPLNLHVHGCEYDLYAIVNHYGSLTGGHYTAQIKSYENHLWYQFNDNIVKRIPQLFGAEVKSLRSSAAYLLMYKKTCRGTPQKFEKPTTFQRRRVAERPHHCEAFCAPSDVEDAPARHDQEEERKTCVTELQCESRYRAENLRHSNHSALVENHNCTVWEGARGRGENVNQGTACLRQHRGAADGGTACTSPPTYDSSALQRDRGQESRELNRQQTNRSSVVQPMRHCYTRGSPTAKLKSRKQQNSCLPQAGTNKRKGFNHQYCREPWR